MSLDQLYLARPLPSLSDYRSPIKGLYLCGSGSHPGLPLPFLEYTVIVIVPFGWLYIYVHLCRLVWSCMTFWCWKCTVSDLWITSYHDYWWYGNEVRVVKSCEWITTTLTALNKWILTPFVCSMASQVAVWWGPLAGTLLSLSWLTWNVAETWHVITGWSAVCNVQPLPGQICKNHSSSLSDQLCPHHVMQISLFTKISVPGMEVYLMIHRERMKDDSERWLEYGWLWMIRRIVSVQFQTLHDLSMPNAHQCSKS